LQAFFEGCIVPGNHGEPPGMEFLILYIGGSNYESPPDQVDSFPLYPVLSLSIKMNL